ncbi:MAG: hypothetical protein K9L98_01960 [Candidatus Pacebacteria bacterium]|nr:hypothetical protein [Candidatus Paceibacterota bacterium]MCF7862752.1 hypothetical protein [Candidatus Paceibacterota bacterium]
MEKIRVGVIRGGEHDYEDSLQKGGKLLSVLSDNLYDKWKPLDIFIDKKGVWHLYGIPVLPSELKDKIDIFWNTSHPAFSSVLESSGVSSPIIGHSSFSHAVSENRRMFEQHLKTNSINVQKSFIIPAYKKELDGPIEECSLNRAKETHLKFAPPWIVKVFPSGVMSGHRVAKNFNELINLIYEGLQTGESLLVQEFMTGKNIQVHSVKGFRGQDIYMFPNASLHKDEKEKIVSLVKDLHKHLDTDHYLHSEFVVTPRKRVYISGFSVFPILEEESSFHKACVSVGAKMHDVLKHIMEHKLEKHHDLERRFQQEVF